MMPSWIQRYACIIAGIANKLFMPCACPIYYCRLLLQSHQATQLYESRCKRYVETIQMSGNVMSHHIPSSNNTELNHCIDGVVDPQSTKY